MKVFPLYLFHFLSVPRKCLPSMSHFHRKGPQAAIIALEFGRSDHLWQHELPAGWIIVRCISECFHNSGFYLSEGTKLNNFLILYSRNVKRSSPMGCNRKCYSKHNLNRAILSAGNRFLAHTALTRIPDYTLSKQTMQFRERFRRIIGVVCIE